jgi:hypothetical protein
LRKRPLLAVRCATKKTNVSEPLLTHRNGERWHRNRGCAYLPGHWRARSGAPSARKRPACCPGGARCRGGVSLSQALAWNRRTCRPDSDDQLKWAQLGPLVARGRTPRGPHPEAQSTEVGHRGGPARISGDGPVMGPE